MVLVEETNGGDTSRPECPCDDQERQPLAGTNRLLVTDTPVLSVEGPQSVPSRISIVLVDGTMAGDTPGRECPREDEYWRPRAGETRPAGVSVGGGDAGLRVLRKRCPPLMLPGSPALWCPLGVPPQ